MIVLLNEYICTLRKKSLPLLPVGTVKCTLLAPLPLLQAQNTNFIRKIKRELKLSFFYHVQLIDNTFDTSFSEIRPVHQKWYSFGQLCIMYNNQKFCWLACHLSFLCWPCLDEHTIKPGTPEHRTTEYGTPAEQGTPWNSGGTTEHLL